MDITNKGKEDKVIKLGKGTLTLEKAHLTSHDQAYNISIFLNGFGWQQLVGIVNSCKNDTKSWKLVAIWLDWKLRRVF